MENKTTYLFRLIYFVGLVVVFLSLFLEWYSFQVFTLENDLLVSWNYYVFSSWQTPFSADSTINIIMKPENIPIPLALNIILIIVILTAGYVVLFKDIDHAEHLRNYNKYAYINIFLILLIGYYLIICPMMYLFPNNLYFPFLSIRDYNLEYIFIYSIGPGYLLQIISFPLIFPYSVFYYKTTSSFIQQEKTPEKIIQKVIHNSQEPLDLDRYIAEEKLNKEKDMKISDEQINIILKNFTEGGKK